MLQINTCNYASDALEDAMRLAQTKALNSFTFSDCLNYLNYTWRDIYDRLAMIDDGYYGVNMKLTKKLTKLPAFVRNTLQVYAAQSPVGYDRLPYRSSGMTDMTASITYNISGTDLYCPDAERTSVWLYYVPACTQIFFTHHNRDPIIHEEDVPVVRNKVYGLYEILGIDSEGNEIDITTAENLFSITKWIKRHRSTRKDEDITEQLKAAPLDEEDAGEWQICYLSCDFPYIFITYVHSITGEHLSGFFDTEGFNEYNPFAFTGRNSNIEYVKCNWNDKTGMGVTVIDYNDSYTVKIDSEHTEVKYRVKELGWTPDTQLNYPAPEMYRYLVARLADKLSAINESNVMGVQKELVEAHYAFEAFIAKDKSAFKRINNVNPATIGDLL